MMPFRFIPRTLLRLPNAQRCVPTALRKIASRPRAFSRSAIALAGKEAPVDPPHSTLNDFLAQKKVRYLCICLATTGEGCRVTWLRVQVIWPTKVDAGPATFHAKTTVKGEGRMH